mmetsp:Transcript_4425/g.4886  ORF Transcript_4425/g.4886 Transcript_4425/m.4886 type:complete len:322 (-) Transcript_4425:3324-4289(-)
MFISIRRLIVLIAIAQLVASFNAVPVLIASHRLVKGLKEELSGSGPQTPERATNLIKRLVTECSSDEYLVINQPGLMLEDMTVKESENWPFLRRYLTMASSVVGIPWVRGPLDLDFIEQYIISTCYAETMNVVHDDDQEVEAYIDTRTRVIKIDLSELPPREDLELRYSVIREHDELIRKIIRKLPSPHYTIILTSDMPQHVHPIPNSVVESEPEKYQIFHDLVNEPSRELEVERNDRFHKTVEPYWSPDRNTIKRYMENKKKDEIHFFDYDLWTRNEKLILTIIVMVLTLFTFQLTKFVRVISKTILIKDKGLITHTKSD